MPDKLTKALKLFRENSGMTDPTPKKKSRSKSDSAKTNKAVFESLKNLDKAGKTILNYMDKDSVNISRPKGGGLGRSIPAVLNFLREFGYISDHFLYPPERTGREVFNDSTLSLSQLDEVDEAFGGDRSFTQRKAFTTSHSDGSTSIKLRSYPRKK